MTGGSSQFPCVEDRIYNDLQAMRPFQSSFTLRPAGKKFRKKKANKHAACDNNFWYSYSEHIDVHPDSV